MTIKKILLGLLTLLVAFLLLLTLYLPVELLKVNNRQPEQTPADFQLTFEDIYFQPKDEAINIHSWWIPAANAKAIILMVHGANGSKEGGFSGSLSLYQDLNQRGYSILAPDLRNHGTSGRSQSGILNMGYSEQLDVVAGLDFIEDRNTNKLPVFAFGLSMGGATVIYAANTDSRIQAAALFDPMLNLNSTMFAGIKIETGLNQWLAAPVVWGAKQFHHLSPYNAYDTALTLKQPLLLLQDIGDPVTQAPFAQALKKERPATEYLSFEDPAADHPVHHRSEGWGTHVAAYLLQPKIFVNALDAFYSQNIPADITAEIKSTETVTD